jgi:hypothetical protein
LLVTCATFDEVTGADLLIGPVEGDVFFNSIRNMIPVAKGTIVDVRIYKIALVKVREICHITPSFYTLAGSARLPGLPTFKCSPTEIGASALLG